MKMTPNQTLFDWPYGMFNRFISKPIILYMESGMMDIKRSGSKDPEAYKPATFHKMQNLCPYTGMLAIQAWKLAPEPNSCPTTKVTIKASEAKDLAASIESETLGCSPKSDTVTMEDPAGSHLVCYYTYSPSFSTPIGFMPSTSINGNFAMSDVHQQSLRDTASASKSTTMDKTCRLEEGGKEVFKDPGKNPVFCGLDMLIRKQNLVKKPASVYTGKLKMFIQALYGTKEGKVKVTWDKYGNISQSLPYPGAPQNVALRSPVELNDTDYLLYTDDKFNYYLINTLGGGMFNILQPDELGRSLRNWMLENKDTFYSDKKKRWAYEAYLLSTCQCKKWQGFGPAATAAMMKTKGHGSPMAFGWKANVQGNQWAVVNIELKDNHAVSTLHEASVSIDQGEMDLLITTERDRRMDSLRDQIENKLPTGVIRATYTGLNVKYTKKLITIGQVKIDLECLEGDPDSGEWHYAYIEEVVKPGEQPKLTPEQVEKLKKDAEEDEKQYGGLLYSKDYYNTLKRLWSISISTTGPVNFQVSYMRDKMCTFDDEFQLYRHNPTCEDDPKFPRPTFNGSFPVYCWYDIDDNLMKVEYHYTDNTNFMNTGFSEPIPCGGGSWASQSENYQNGTIMSGFVVNGNMLCTGKTGHRSASASESTIDAGKDPGMWDVSCRLLTSCIKPVVLRFNYSSIRYFYRYWEKLWWGEGSSTFSSESDYEECGSFLMIPRHDCEGVYIGSKSGKGGSKTTGSQTFLGLTTLQIYSLSNSGWETCLSWAGFTSIVKITCAGLWAGAIKYGSKNQGPLWLNGGAFSGNNSRIRRWGVSGEDRAIYDGPAMPAGQESGGTVGDPWVLDRMRFLSSQSETQSNSSLKATIMFFGRKGVANTLQHEEVSKNQTVVSNYSVSREKAKFTAGYHGSYVIEAINDAWGPQPSGASVVTGEAAVLLLGAYDDFFGWLSPKEPFIATFGTQTSLQSFQGVAIVRGNGLKKFPENIGIPSSSTCKYFVGSI